MKQSGLKRFFKKVFNKEASKEERRRAIVNLEIQDIEDSESRNGKLLSGVWLSLVELLSSEMGQQKTKMEMTIVAELYDSLQASCAFYVEFKVGEEVVGEWEWPAKN